MQQLDQVQHYLHVRERLRVPIIGVYPDGDSIVQDVSLMDEWKDYTS